MAVVFRSTPRCASRPATVRGWKARAKDGPVWRAEDGMQVFPLLFPHCAEPMTIIAFVAEAGSIKRILEYLG